MKNNIDNKNKQPFVVAFDYDGVITKRGSSGLNEELWLERESNFVWRQILNIVSTVYNRFGALNDEIVPTINELKNLNKSYHVIIMVITSHTLTTTDYKLSELTRNRIKNRLIKENIIVDDIIYVAGDKVEVCKEYNVNLMIEDNVSKVKALRNSGITTVAKITDKNADELIDDHCAVPYLTDIIKIAKQEMDKLDSKNNIINTNNQKEEKEHNKKKLYAKFNEEIQEETYEVNNTLNQNNNLILKKTYREYK